MAKCKGSWFCKVKARKLLVSLGLALCGGAALGLLSYFDAVGVDNLLLAEVSVVVTPWAVNAIRVLLKG